MAIAKNRIPWTQQWEEKGLKKGFEKGFKKGVMKSLVLVSIPSPILI